VVHAARSSPSVRDVLPGDERAVSRGEDWFRRDADTRDPAVREQIIVAYLGLADRLADRYDPDYGSSFVPYAVACVVGESKLPARHELAGPRLPAGQGALPVGPQGP
jgi:hypothetical protein